MKEPQALDNSMDVIDSRDVIARIDFLEGEWVDVNDALKEAVSHVDDDPEDKLWVAIEEECRTNVSEWEDEFLDELKALQKLQEEAEGCCDWRYGETLIRDSYFTEYAQELAEDIGAIDPKASWPLGHIDWVSAAEELQQDYTTVDFDGVEYWVRNC
jgi:hypothetical protein